MGPLVVKSQKTSNNNKKHIFNSWLKWNLWYDVPYLTVHFPTNGCYIIVLQMLLKEMIYDE